MGLGSRRQYNLNSRWDQLRTVTSTGPPGSAPGRTGAARPVRPGRTQAGLAAAAGGPGQPTG